MFVEDYICHRRQIRTEIPVITGYGSIDWVADRIDRKAASNGMKPNHLASLSIDLVDGLVGGIESPRSRDSPTKEALC